MARSIVLSTALCGLALAAAGAQAQDFHVNVALGPEAASPGTVTAYRNLPSGSLYTPFPGHVLAGRYTFSVTDAVLPASVPQALGRSFHGYCVDLSNLDNSPTTFKSATLIDGGASSGTLFKKGTTNYPGALKAADPSLNIFGRLQEAAWIINNYGNGASLSGDAAAGVQLAVWNVIEDTDFSVSSAASSTGPEGSYFKASGFTSAAISDANLYLGGLHTALNSGGGKASAYYLHTEGGQDSLAAFSPGPNDVTPEGSSALLLAAGGVPLWVLLRRRRSRSR
jgi:hypothetical protein